MSDRLQEIRDRLDQATPGEWDAGPHPNNAAPHVRAYLDDGYGSYLVVCEWAGENSEFIANAPADIRWLLTRVSELETECGRTSRNS